MNLSTTRKASTICYMGARGLDFSAFFCLSQNMVRVYCCRPFLIYLIATDNKGQSETIT